METNILLKRGTSINLNTLSLKTGEPAFVTDTGKFYIGNGKNKVLINPIEKPVGINSTYYSKIKVNDYGQVIEQTNLLATDIPDLPNTKIIGLGTSSTLNTGTTAGTIPLIENNGKLSDNIIPSLNSTLAYAMATYMGSDGVQVQPGAYAPLSGFITSNNNQFSIDSKGIITVNLRGVYLISYNISSASSSISTSIGNGATINYPGSMARSSATAVPSYVNVGATIIKNVTTVPEKYGIRNNGSNNFPMLSVHGVLTITKIG